MNITPHTGRPRILIFIGSLRAGGKERRLIELLCYLKDKGDFEFMLVMTMDIVHYPIFYKLNIPYRIIKKVDYSIFYQFHKICRQYNPHLIHTWGRMQTFYTLPTVLIQRIPLVNSQITSAPPNPKKWSFPRIIDKVNFFFSKMILPNSKAGAESFKPPLNKSRVIYNGINMNRFSNLPCIEQVKLKYGISTPYTVVMSASFSPNKDYNLFYKVAEQVTLLRDDVTFIGVGESHDDYKFKKLLEVSSKNSRIIFPGRISDVEALVNACNIGVLFSVNGEGISNSIMEYMALSKPVIASAAGGTKEIVYHNKNGYLISDQTAEEISAMIVDLINDKDKCQSFGKESRRIIEESFSLESMGKAYKLAYQEALSGSRAEKTEILSHQLKSS